MAYWEAQQEAEYASEKSSLERDISSAESTEKKKSIYSVGGGMVGAIGAPLLAAALAPMTGGASMAIPTLMGLVGAGSAVGRTVGSALGGKSKKIGGGTFLKDKRSRSQSLIDEAGTQRRKDIIWGSIKDAGTAGFLKSGGLDAFKEIGAKGLTKFFGKDTAESLYKASGMMATGDEFSTLLEGTKAKDMWSNLGEINPLQIRKNLIGKRDLKAAKKSLTSAGTFADVEAMKARISDKSAFGKDDFLEGTYKESLKRSNALGDKNLNLLPVDIKDVETGRKLFPGNPYDEAALHQSQAKHLFRSPMQKPTSTPVQNAQSMLNQKVSMYNNVWDEYSQET